MNNEKVALDTLKALGAKDTTSNAQKKNGTTSKIQSTRIIKRRYCC